MTYDPNAYQHLPGALPLRLVNVPPHHGERLIGYIGFGLSGLSGFNMIGKSVGLDALEAVAVPRLEAGALVPTRGAERLEVHYGGWGLVLYAEPEEGGQRKRTQRTKGDASDGPIVTLAPEILALRTGEHRVDPVTRWKARLKALLGFCPVEVTDERLKALLPNVQVDTNAIAGLIRGFASQDFRSLLDAAEWLAGARGELNQLALAVEKDAARALARENEAAGAVKAIWQRAVGDDAIKTAVRSELHELERSLFLAPLSAPDRHREAEREHARMEERRERYVAELARREELRAAHGERPDTTAAELAVASLVVERDEHERRIAELDGERERCSALEAASRRTLASLTARHGNASNKLVDAVGRLVARYAGNHLPRLADYRSLEEGVNVCLGALTAIVEDAQPDLEALDVHLRRREEMQGLLAAAETARASADTALTARSIELQAARDSLAAWESVEALLAAELTGPSEEEVQESAATLEALRTEAELTKLGVEYRQATAEHETRAAARKALEDEAKRLRAEVGATWTRLGAVVSDAIQSDVVRVGAEGAVEVKYDGTWYNAEDVQGLSGGALCRALLELYIERTRGPATVRLARELSELVVLPMDGPNRRRIAAKAAAKELRLVFELPVDKDGEEIEVVHYGGQL